jgi:hypothetical protein
MWLPYARTLDEADLYVDLRPCPCGESEFERTATTLSLPAEPDDPAEAPAGATATQAVAIGGVCVSCGRERRFSFTMPAALPDLGPGVRFSDGTERSRLLDAGEWLGVAELFEANAEELRDTADLSDEEVHQRLRYLAAAAAAATGEVLLFLPDGGADGDQVPEGAFWSQAGRAIYELSPERFRRANLVAELAIRQRLRSAMDGGAATAP